MEKRWVGDKNSNWEVADNWEPPGVPSVMDDVVLPAGSEVTVVGRVKANTIRGE